MRFQRILVLRLTLASLCLVFGARDAVSQQRQPPQEDVIRVNADLVQTDVMVFSKGGSFIDGLKREQFELKIDGRPHEISFFERVAAGSRNEESQLAAARGVANSGGSAGPPIPLDRGRTVFFYLDDIHLSASSIAQARQLLKRFIDREMGQNDEAAITSATGQLGFLEQLTENKTVLRTAAERLKSRLFSARDADRPPMTEYQAILIEQNDTDVINVFIDALLRDNPGIPRQVAGDMVRQRASAILQQAARFTTASLASLEGVVRSAAPLPGRKVLFLISDGFFLDQRNSDVPDRLRVISSSAARSGIVIYSLDARGLIVDTDDISSGGVFDPTGRLQRAAIGEINASQDGLNSLARDTGGRAIFNTNDLSHAVTTGLKETSVYYLLAWRPESEAQRTNSYKRLEVRVVNRPELIVRIRRNFSHTEAIEDTAKTRNKNPANPKTGEEDLREALRAIYPRKALPVSLVLHFLNLPDAGTVMNASLKILAGPEAFSPLNGKPTALVDIIGVVYDDQGKPASGFQEHLTITANSPEVQLKSTNSLMYNFRAPLRPGLYQVRVAARDHKSGRTGSAMGWIEVPDLAQHRLALSSIIAAERTLNNDGDADPRNNKSESNDQNALSPAKLNIERRFSRTSYLGFLVFAYNATTDGLPSVTVAEGAAPIKKTAPDLAIQVQVIRDNEPVITTPLRKIETDGLDLTRLPYAAEIPLQNLPAGRYLLKVTVIDRIAKTSATQQLDFEVD